MSLSLIRRALFLAAITAMAWTAVSVTSLIERESKAYLDAMVLVPFVLTGVAFVSLHQLQRDALGRFGRVSFWISAAAMTALVIAQTTIMAGSERLLWLGFPVGVLAWLAGFALYGYATAKAGVLPPRIGLGLAIAEPLTIVMGLALSPLVPLSDSGNFSGAIGHAANWFGITWLLAGLVNRSESGAARPEQSLAAD